MENQNKKKNSLMWNIINEHGMLKEHSPGHPLLKYCRPWEEDGMLEWSERFIDEFYDKFRSEKEKKNGYSLVKEILTPKKERKNGYTTASESRNVKTNYYNALRDATNKFNGIDELV